MCYNYIATDMNGYGMNTYKMIQLNQEKSVITNVKKK